MKDEMEFSCTPRLAPAAQACNITFTAASTLVTTMSPDSALPTPEAIPASLQDEQAVTAVREGDIARYRELVERYQRRVYAVAWSRLGDAALAEEATQEAFIRAFRSLPLLRDGTKFPAWISAIARNLSISLGLRHHRELNKRARWALEQPTAEASVSAEESVCTPEMLRQTLAELSAKHRECLVLFYLENKSGAEAAALLGISEPALRVRLLRARAALREKLEERLGQSLGQLRPSSNLASSVMAVITSTSSAKTIGGAGVGATIAAGAAKILPFKLATALIPLAPGLGLVWSMNRADRLNYRDAEGFRVRLHRSNSRRDMLVLSGIFLLCVMITRAADPLLEPFINLLVGILCLGALGFWARSMQIKRSRYHINFFINIICTTFGILAVALGWIPQVLFPFIMLLGSLTVMTTINERPLRMDYNLFLRAVQGMLRTTAGDEELICDPSNYTRSQLLAFARFLGDRFLVDNFLWQESGLRLRLPDAKSLSIGEIIRRFPSRWKYSSWIDLGSNGTVSAHCSKGDDAFFLTLAVPYRAAGPELEARVTQAVSVAWARFRTGDETSAERILGQVPDSELFVVPLKHTTRYPGWYKFAVVVLVAFICVILAAMHETPADKQAQPISNQLRATMDQLDQEDSQVVALRDQIAIHTIQIQQLEQQAQDAELGIVRVPGSKASAADLQKPTQPPAPARAAALRQQADQLTKQNQLALARIDQIHEHEHQEDLKAKQLRQQIDEILNGPAIPATATTPAAPSE
jgi:RNA polymerase sigma factor (sigma-70 family)